MNEFFSPRSLAVIQLGANASEKAIAAAVRTINARARREGWTERRNASGQPLATRREGKGGGWEYHYSLLTAPEQVKFCSAQAPKKAAMRSIEAAPDDIARDDMWSWYADIPDSKKKTAVERAQVLDTIETLQNGGMTKTGAVEIAKGQFSVPASTIYTWFKLVAGKPRTDWLPYLAPKHTGRTKVEDIDPRVMDWVRSDYLRPERPTMTSCYRRMSQVAKDQNWPIPSKRTVERRIEKIPTTVKVLARDGVEALKRMFPAQERDRSCFHALEAVNADGHKFDVWVNWPGEPKPIRPMMVAVQDLYSGKILSWRLDKSENKEAVLLAFGDVIETFGIPDRVYLDNGRSFASKWITGGTPTRYRFKIKDEDPAGLLTNLGCTVIFVTPYSGQSKPIERAFKDFCNDIAKHPAFTGAWTGNTVANKPENYGSKAVELETFIKIVADGIAEHNGRVGRRATVCAGRSFDQTFNDSYARSPIQKATEAHRRLWLLAAESVKVRASDQSIHFLGNRYWDEKLIEFSGQSITARFDPDDLQSGLHVYRLDGAYIGFAECIEAKGFNDTAAAREQLRARKQFIQANRAMLDAERRMTPDQLAKMIPAQTITPLAEAKIVKPIIDTSMMVRPHVEAAPLTEREEATRDQVVADLAAFRSEKPKSDIDLKRERYARARAIEEAIDAKIQVDAEDARWLGSYQTTAEYRTMKGISEDFAANLA
tara:strand:- start:31901 stop:34039 length:2139 start_codon:yes stop_codon:yes gene_type:complete